MEDRALLAGYPRDIHCLSSVTLGSQQGATTRPKNLVEDISSRLLPPIGPTIPDSKVHGANMGPIWGRQDPSGPHVGPMNLAIWDSTSGISTDVFCQKRFLTNLHSCLASYRSHSSSGIGIPIITIRRSRDVLIFIMEILMPARRHLFTEIPPLGFNIYVLYVCTMQGLCTWKVYTICKEADICIFGKWCGHFVGTVWLCSCCIVEVETWSGKEAINKSLLTSKLFESK